MSGARLCRIPPDVRPSPGPYRASSITNVGTCFPPPIGGRSAASRAAILRRAAMISFRLEDYHEELRATVAEFARDVVAPVIGGYYEREEFPYEIVARMAKLGLFGLPFPEEYGGMGGDLFAFCLTLEELARVDSSVAITLEAAGALGAMPIYRFGTEEQRRRWLPGPCAGERLGAVGRAPPGGGAGSPRC